MRVFVLLAVCFGLGACAAPPSWESERTQRETLMDGGFWGGRCSPYDGRCW